jgi:TfoX/Sxy family transcriptional regulator of competence genes
MAYNEALAERVRTELLDVPEVDEKRMFGGVTFMVSGQMCCGVLKDELIVKVGADGWDELIAQPYVRPFDFTGRPMVGIVYVSLPGVASDDALHTWIQRGVRYVREHPKTAKAPRGATTSTGRRR